MGLRSAGIAALTLMLLAPAAASADAISLTVPPDRVEEVGFIVTASGQADSNDRRVYATIKPSGSAGCGSTYATDPGGENVILSAPVEGNYSVGGTAEVSNPGPYVLCAWLQQSSSSTTVFAKTSLPVEVRSAVATLDLKGKKRVGRNRAAKIKFSGQAELERQVYARVKRAGGRGCEGAYETDNGDSFLFFEQVQGFFDFREAIDPFMLERRGRYLVCAWVQESASDLAPEASARFKFRVGKKRRHSQ